MLAVITESIMEWTEPQETALERARLQNRVNNALLQIPLHGVVFGLLPAVGVPVASLIQHTNIKWVPYLIFVAGCFLIGAVVGLVQTIRGRSIPRKRSIVLGSHSLTLTDNANSNTVAYQDMVGFSVFEISHGKLLVFGRHMGNNLSIGIPQDISVQDIRSFLTEKLSELQNEEMPDPRRSYAG